MMRININTDNAIDFLSPAKEGRGWIQPSINQSYLPVSNEKIIDGIYAATADEKVIVLAETDQTWFWTEEWQAGEREVDQYIERGEFEEFDSLDDLFSSLKK